MRKSKPKSLYCIQRVDSDKSHTHCWIVRVQRRNRVWKKSFADQALGGKRLALTAAKAYRDEILEENLPMSRAEYASILRTNNQSGHPGVSKRVGTQLDRGRLVHRACWIARWHDVAGNTHRKSFSIFLYGDDGALQLALDARREALEALKTPYSTSIALNDWLSQRPAHISN